MDEGKIHKIQLRYAVLSIKEFIILLLIAFALLSLSFSIHAAFLSSDHKFDNKVFSYIKQFISHRHTGFLLFITYLGHHVFLIPANLLLLAYFIIRKKRQFSIRVIALSLSSLSLMFLLKISIHRARPENPLLEAVSGYSFPSGHALMSVIFYGLLIYIASHEIKVQWIKRSVIIFLLLLILLISYSRIYLRVHYASDVLAGLSVGFIWLMLSLWIIKKIEIRKSRKISD